jgi:hypothetical protein
MGACSCMAGIGDEGACEGQGLDKVRCRQPSDNAKDNNKNSNNNNNKDSSSCALALSRPYLSHVCEHGYFEGEQAQGFAVLAQGLVVLPTLEQGIALLLQLCNHGAATHTDTDTNTGTGTNIEHRGVKTPTIRSTRSGTITERKIQHARDVEQSCCFHSGWQSTKQGSQRLTLGVCGTLGVVCLTLLQVLLELQREHNRGRQAVHYECNARTVETSHR